MRGGKASVWEGAMRAPCLMRWPGKIPAGTTCPQLATTMDLLPTLARLAGTQPPQDRIIDGKDIRSLMTQPTKALSPHEALFYHAGSGKFGAVRSGKWKLHLESGELYDLKIDIGETQDVAAAHPAEVARLRALAQRFDEEITKNSRPMVKAG